MRTLHPLISLLSVALLAITTAGCDPSSTTGPEGPTEIERTLLSTVTDIEQVAERATSSPVRLEIEVRRGGPPWVAREVEVENDEDREEKVESRIVSADASNGTLELLFGGLLVDAASARRYGVEGVGHVSREAFFAHVEARLAAGHRPGVELRRPLPATPQAPNDAGFSALEVELDDDADAGELEVLVDDRHLTVTSSTVGRITVFGIDIEVDPALGTETRERTEDGDDAQEIEGLISGVDPASGRVDLIDGRTFFVIAETRFDTGDEDHLVSLDAVSEALASGHWVEAEAEVVGSTNGSLIAVEAEFEVEDDADEDDIPGAIEGESLVVSVNSGTADFTLVNGWTLEVEARTRIEDGDFHSLAEVADALAEGRSVEAEVLVITEASGQLRLIEVEFELEDDGDDDVPGGIEFESRVSSIDLAAGTFKLVDGRTYLVTATTEYESDGDLFSLSAAASALAGGVPVEMEGDAVADGGAPDGLRVVSLKIETED